MKNILYVIVALSFLTMSCDKKEDFVNEASKVVAMAGEWYVDYEHPTIGDSHYPLLTYNTAADDGKTMWIDDADADPNKDGFWNYKVKVNVDLETMTFSGEGTSVFDDYVVKVKVTNGGIFPNKVLLPSKTMADSIYFEVWFDDLEAKSGKENDKIIVSGYRHSGFTEDDK